MDALSSAPASFIVGHPRSGTSLLRALLDGHPNLLVLPFETHLFDWAKSSDPVTTLLERTLLWPTLHRHRPALSKNEVEGILTRALGQTRGPRARLLALVEGWRKLTGARSDTRWVEKTPRHLYEVGTLLKWFPANSKVLVMRRDPRDVVASELKQKPSTAIFQMALTGRLAHEIVSEYEEDQRFSVINYERLVLDPAGTMHEVCQFLDVPYDPVVITPTALGGGYYGNSRFQAVVEGVSQAAVGRYREVLSKPQLERTEVLLAPLLWSGGYAPALQSPGGGHRIANAAITIVVRSGLWRLRVLRDAFRRA